MSGNLRDSLLNRESFDSLIKSLKLKMRDMEEYREEIELVLQDLQDDETEKEQYEEIQDELETISRSKNIDKQISNLPDESLEGSMISSARYTGEHQIQDDLPIIKAYDQEEFVKKRGEQIKNIKNEAKQLNDIAGEVNGMVHKQDRDLDAFTKKLENNRDNVIKANENLNEAAERQEQNSKNMVCWILLIAVLLLGIVMFVLYSMGIFNNDN